ncbi:hypothetical protein ACL1G5_10270 [Corynebacterium striatum]
MRSLLIDIYDVLHEPVPGDSVTLEVPSVRAGVEGDVIRPYTRIVALTDGKATVDVEPGPLNITMHNHYGQQLTVKVTVPEGTDPVTLRELILLDKGTVDDVPGIREALAGKADTVHTHAIGDVTGLQDALDGKAAAGHTHLVTDISDLSPRLTQLLEAVDNAVTPAELDTRDAELRADILDAAAGRADGLYSPIKHSHVVADVTGLQAALEGKANKAHTHTQDDFSGLTSESKAWQLVQRDGRGDVTVPATPGWSEAATSKSYVDGLIASLDARIKSLGG